MAPSKKFCEKKRKKKTVKRDTAFKLTNGRCFKFSNVKIRFHTDLPFINISSLLKDVSEFYGVTRRGNMFTIRTGLAVYICVSSSCVVNATGFNSLKKIESVLEDFSLIFPLHLKKPETATVIVDNISLFGRVGRNVFTHFPSDVAIFGQCPNTRFSFNNFSFPGATLRGQHATFLVFSTGSVVILGVKDPCRFPIIQSLLNYMIKHKGLLLSRPKDEVLSFSF